MMCDRKMKKVIVIGCPGAGKSTFSRKLSAKTELPLYYLDMIWHRPDRTVIGPEAFDKRLAEIIEEDEWILDGNYLRTLSMRLVQCDTVFYFDLPLAECIEGARARVGKERVDMPWVEDELDPEFLQWIINFPQDVTPGINRLLADFNKTIYRFKSRTEADSFINSLQ